MRSLIRWQAAVAGLLLGCLAACGNAERPVTPSAASLVEQARAALAQAQSAHLDARTTWIVTREGEKPKSLNAGFKGWVTQTDWAGKVRLKTEDETPTVLVGGRLYSFVTPAVARLLPDQADNVNTWDETGIANLEFFAGQGAATLTLLRQMLEPSDTPQSTGEERVDGQDALLARYNVANKKAEGGVTISVAAKAPHRPIKIEFTYKGETVGVYRLSRFGEGPPIVAPTGSATPGTG